MNIIFISTLILSILGIVIGLFLGFFSDIFNVEVDKRVEQIREVLPGNNCGSCGYAGCDGLAEAIVKGEAEINACPVGGETVARNISAIMGIDSNIEAKEKKVAFVFCNGNCENVQRAYNYDGVKSCALASNLSNNGDKACSFACIGYGDCVRKCKFDAIHIIDGVAVVDKEKCVSCSACVNACPMRIIYLIPYNKKFLVKCNNKDKGSIAKSKCKTSCIGCKICEKNCNQKAIEVKNNLAVMNYEKCNDCGVCHSKCPQKVIINNH